MYKYWQQIKDAVRKGDMVLLLLCLITTAFGCLIISSVTAYMGSFRFVAMQIVAALIGVLFFTIVSSIDAEVFAEHRAVLVAITYFLLFLLIPFGTDNDTGNKSWLNFPFLPFDIQPAEICKIFYVLIMASIMASHQNKISSVPSVIHMTVHLILLVGFNLVVSSDMGVSMIFVFIFVVMAFSGGVNLFWFAVAGGGIALVWPVFWNHILSEYQRLRFEVLFNPELDPLGTGPRYHTMLSLRSLTGGAMTGQGLYNGHRTQQGALFAQHTDYIFSAIGEELGYVGCIVVLVLLGLIVARCIWVGARSQDYMRRMICFGVAGALIFQIMINVGMCIGVMPVIGLTLPFVSYGGSSLVSLYAMMGLVSGVFARPASISHERYIRPPYTL